MTKQTLAHSMIVLIIAMLAYIAGAYTVMLNQPAKDWSSVMVIQNGTLVANPDALTPDELADAQIISKYVKYIGYQCNGERTIRTADHAEDLADCKDTQQLVK